MSLTFTTVETRLGKYTVVAHNGLIVKIQLPGAETPWQDEVARWFPDEIPQEIDDPVLELARMQLIEYAEGLRQDFELPVKQMGTDFQNAVWNALRAIPYGETRSYADLARMVGRPGAARAVGQANAKNPVPLVQPCHRVLNADGGLGGWMGGPADEGSLKAELLRLESGPSDGLRPLGRPASHGLESA